MQDVERVVCYICGQSDGAVWSQENGYRLIKCAGCGLLYVNPRPAQALISQATRTGMHETDAGRLNEIGWYRRRRMMRYRQVLQHMFAAEQLNGRPIRWLDVGAGFGEMVAAVRSLAHRDSVVEGIEPCVPKAKAAAAHGLNVTARPIDDVTGRYDVVSLMNVYSHLPDPVAFLEQLKGLIVDDGELFLLTGNGADVAADEIARPLYLPDHLSFAGQRHLRIVIERAGFQIVKLEAWPLDTRGIWYANLAKRMLGRPLRQVNSNSANRDVFVRARKVGIAAGGAGG